MKFVAKTLYGLEKVLSEELIGAGAKNVVTANRAVTFSGDMKLLYKLNYSLRSALSLLMPVAEFRIKSKDDLYRESSKIDWEKYLDSDGTFSVVPVVKSSLFKHSGFPALVIKDSIADYFRKRTGHRPSVDPVDPDIVINLHISNDSVTVSLDSSVIPLYKRGYRQEQSLAPINEVLAAGIILMSGWDPSLTLYDPMCGSGTFSIEAGLMACRIPPGKFRNFFGFQSWKNYDNDLFMKIKEESEKEITISKLKIFGSDISGRVLQYAKNNAENAGLADVLNLKVADFKDLKSLDESGIMFINPPYGQRIRPDEINQLYSMIGTTLKHNFPGTNAWIITSNKESVKHIGLKSAEKHLLYNGALECLLLKYEMYRGTKKDQDVIN